MSAITPGPWEWRNGVLYGTDSPNIAAIINDDGCTIHRGPIGADKAPDINVWINEMVANRRLIAAAPDLLAALKEITDPARGMVSIPQSKAAAFERARAAIAKAEAA